MIDRAHLRQRARHVAHRVVRRAGYEISRFPPTDFRDDDIEMLQRVEPFTATSAERIYVLRDTVRQLVRNDVPGAFVESGVWRGGSMMAVALTLKQLDVLDRDLYLFDTYTGMVDPTDEDVLGNGLRAEEQLGTRTETTALSPWMIAPLEHVKENMASTGYPEARIHYVVGDVRETVAVESPPTIALARLDTDWYESTRAELAAFYPRLSPGGALLLDDYGHWMGVKQATDEFLAGLDAPPLLHRVDDAARILVRP